MADPFLLNGVTDPTTHHYGFWSGIGSVIVPPIITVAGVALVAWWHSICHEAGCLRIGRHPHGHFKYCKKHHPEIT